MQFLFFLDQVFRRRSRGCVSHVECMILGLNSARFGLFTSVCMVSEHAMKREINNCQRFSILSCFKRKIVFPRSFIRAKIQSHLLKELPSIIVIVQYWSLYHYQYYFCFIVCYKEDTMAQSDLATAMADRLNMGGLVHPRHLPSHVKFCVSSSPASNQKTFSPLKLSTLASTLIVANTHPVDVQR